MKVSTTSKHWSL